MTTTPPDVVDACAHPSVADPDDLRDYLELPWRNRRFPGPERYHYALPTGEYLPDLRGTGLPGSDPRELAERLLGGAERTIVVLLPMTRGLLPDIDLSSMLCRAGNDWLVDRWLTEHNDHGCFRGTIRVDPRDPAAAVEEVHRWAANPLMVQIGIPTQAHQPYGHRGYLPLWEAAAAHDLPVVVHADGGAGVGFATTSAGEVRSAIEYNISSSLNYMWHLTSLIGEGVLERLPNLRFVFADGGHDIAIPLIWRLDKDWRPCREDMPWVTSPPSHYLMRQVRFITHRFEGPLDAAAVHPWAELSRARHLLMYGSRYPRWNTWPADDVLRDEPEDVRHAVLSANAFAFLRRLSPMPTSAPPSPAR